MKKVPVLMDIEVKEALQKLKIIPRESYSDVMARLIKKSK